ncbi:NTP transferase domain-containing protein [Reinekea marina]|uniref:NTP transferase domain-containing protein n=2 Tax=Reinekea marina TaxID=1310421 RepID=A0ABV7WM94_9GAMM
MHKFAICILAAGGSKRLGTPKQQLCVRGESLLARQATMASATGHPVYVVLNDTPEATALSTQLSASVIANTHWQQGMASSIHRIVEQVSAQAWLFMTVDQYRLTVAHLNTMIDLWLQSGSSKTVVASSYQDVVGVPALITKHYRAKLLSLTGEQGAGRFIRALKKQQPNDCLQVQNEALAFDVDVVEDLSAFTDYFQ